MSTIKCDIYISPSAVNRVKMKRFAMIHPEEEPHNATLFISENGEAQKVYTEEELAQILMRLGDDLRFRSAVTRSDFEDALTELKLPILP